MRILIISPHVPPRHCGVADHVAIQIRELAKQKHRVTILTGIENTKRKVLIDNKNTGDNGSLYPHILLFKAMIIGFID